MTQPVDAAAIATAASDVRRLVRETPERLLWSPGRPIWGLALVSGTSNAILCVDGTLAVAHTIWPSHYVAGGTYQLDGVVRALAGALRIGRLGDQAIFACRLPDTVVGACCVVIAQSDLPWLPQDHEVLPVVDTPIWTAPTDPRSSAALLPIHPWQTMSGLREGPPAAAGYLAAIGEPAEMQVLPERIRIERLTAYWRMHVLHERSRLEVIQKPVPAWLGDDGEIWRLAEAWVAGWRGPGEPAIEALSTSRETAPVAVAGEPDLVGGATSPAVEPDFPGGGLANPWLSTGT